jgi:hypothetical protein
MRAEPEAAVAPFGREDAASSIASVNRLDGLAAILGAACNVGRRCSTIRTGRWDRPR